MVEYTRRGHKPNIYWFTASYMNNNTSFISNDLTGDFGI